MPPYSKFFLTILIAGMILVVVKMLKYRKSHFLVSSIVGSLIFAFFFTGSSRMPRPLAAWMNGQKISKGGA